MEHTLHSEAFVLLISRSQSEERSKMGVCNPLGVEPLTRSSEREKTKTKTKNICTYLYMELKHFSLSNNMAGLLQTVKEL